MHGGAAHAAMVNALRASGVIVRVRPEDFLALLRRVEEPLVVAAQGGLLRKSYQYLTSYKGLAFYAQSATPLMLPRTVETVLAEKIWIPG
jgi:hypothetical protein